MKKFILMLIFVLGSFVFAEIRDKDVESFFSPKTQVLYFKSERLVLWNISS